MAKIEDVNVFIKEANSIHFGKYDYSLVTITKHCTEKIKIKCNNCLMIFEQIPYKHLIGSGCFKCRKTRKISSTDCFVEKAIKVHGDHYDYSLVEYKHNKKKVKIKCKKCSDAFEQRPNDHLRKHGCAKCGKNIGIIKKTYTTKEFIENVIEIHGNKYDYSLVDYKHNNIKIKIKCNKCLNIFEQTPKDHYRFGCPKCKSSKGEERIRKFLQQNNIVFEEQKRFDNCKNKQTLPFDFYLPQQNILIEYDGIQHFKEIELWGGKKGLLSIQKNDAIKNDFVKENKIILLRISYIEFNNIEIIVDKIKAIQR